MSIPTILEVSPIDGYNQWPVTGTLTVLFDQEIDAYSAARAAFIHGPEIDVFVGPDMGNAIGGGWNPTEAMLNSPGYQGDAPVRIEVVKTDSSGTKLDDQFTYDPADAQFSLLRITPNKALYELTDYRLFLAGDSIENTMSINSRSVFDAAANVANTGSGELISSGVYNGVDEETLVIEFTRAGDENEARYNWYFESNPGAVDSRRSFAGIQEIINGLFIEAFGTFSIGDIFTVKLVPAEQFESTIVINFTTAANHVTELPDNVSTSPISLGPGSSYDIDKSFKLLKCKPDNGASNITLNTNQLVFTFSKDLDPASITHEAIKVLRESVDGSDPSSVPYSFIVSGKKLYINLMEH